MPLVEVDDEVNGLCRTRAVEVRENVVPRVIVGGFEFSRPADHRVVAAEYSGFLASHPDVKVGFVANKEVEGLVASAGAVEADLLLVAFFQVADGGLKVQGINVEAALKGSSVKDPVRPGNGEE